MSTYESSITNPKKQLEFYKDLSEQLEKENQELKEKLERIQKDKMNCIRVLLDDKYCEEIKGSDK